MASLSCVCYRTMSKESKEQERCGLYSSDTNLYFEQPRSIFWGCSTKRGPSFLGIWEYNNIHNVEFSSYLLFNLSVSRFFLVCLPKSLLISCLNLVFPYISSFPLLSLSDGLIRWHYLISQSKGTFHGC